MLPSVLRQLPEIQDSRSEKFLMLNIPKYQRPLTLAQLNVQPSTPLQGRFQKIAFSDHLCLCGSNEIELVIHVLLSCSFYKEIREKLLFDTRLEINALLRCFRATEDRDTVEAFAKPFLNAMRRRSLQN